MHQRMPNRLRSNRTWARLALENHGAGNGKSSFVHQRAWFSVRSTHGKPTVQPAWPVAGANSLRCRFPIGLILTTNS